MCPSFGVWADRVGTKAGASAGGHAQGKTNAGRVWGPGGCCTGLRGEGGRGRGGKEAVEGGSDGDRGGGWGLNNENNIVGGAHLVCTTGHHYGADALARQGDVEGLADARTKPQHFRVHVQRGQRARGEDHRPEPLKHRGSGDGGIWTGGKATPKSKQALLRMPGSFASRERTEGHCEWWHRHVAVPMQVSCSTGSRAACRAAAGLYGSRITMNPSGYVDNRVTKSVTNCSGEYSSTSVT